MAVKVLINRLIKENKIDDALSLLKEIRIKAMDHPGYISGESLVNHYNPRNIMIIATWQTRDGEPDEELIRVLTGKQDRGREGE